jgi:cytochrome bd-type quinol oxidase subunit 2
MLNYKIGIITLALSLLIIPFLFSARISAQDIPNNLCAGANLNVNTNCNTGVTEQDATGKINRLIATIINLFSLIVGVVSVIMIIIGGFRYITSGGDSNNVTSAKNTILYAIIGLIIVALAQTIVRFVLRQVLEV